MKKTLGIFGLLVVVWGLAVVLNPRFVNSTPDLVHRSSLYAIMSIGVAFVIITGGIDLSIGALIGLVGVLLPMLVRSTTDPIQPGYGWPVALAVATVLGIALAVGLIHGLLITKLRLQPFIVTLCGLMFYRGLARLITGDTQQGFLEHFKGLRILGEDRIPIPESVPLVGGGNVSGPFLFLVVITVLAAVFLNLTVYGRYLLALGRNEQAARFSGIKTDRMIILTYVISSLLAGLTGVLFILDINSAQPSSFGDTYELWAIAAAVLGGCSLRGGEGSILGVVIGAAVLQVLRTAITIVTSYQYIELLIIGVVLLAGVTVDELVKRLAARRRAAREAVT
jgi:ribose transport system permease protein